MPVGLKDLSVGPETFAKHLNTHLFRAGFSDQALTFEFVLHFVPSSGVWMFLKRYHHLWKCLFQTFQPLLANCVSVLALLRRSFVGLNLLNHNDLFGLEILIPG